MVDFHYLYIVATSTIYSISSCAAAAAASCCWVEETPLEIETKVIGEIVTEISGISFCK